MRKSDNYEPSCTTQGKYIERILKTVPDYIQKVHCDTTPTTMPFSCAIKTCQNSFLVYDTQSPVKYHKFSSVLNSTVCETWRRVCGIPQSVNISELMVCSDHFILDDYIRNYKEEFSNPKFKRKLKSNAIPHLIFSAISKDSNNSPNNCFSLGTKIQVKPLHSETEVTHSVSLTHKNEDAAVESDLLQKIHTTAIKDNISCKIRLLRLNKILQTKALQYKMTQRHFQHIKTIKRKHILKKVFSQAQLKKLKGYKKVYWSEDDLAMAFSLRHMGGRDCYLYLKNILNLPLPKLSCIQRWANTIE